MEALVLISLLGLGFALQPGKPVTKETFTNQVAVQGKRTVRRPARTVTGELDTQYLLPNGETYASEPSPQSEPISVFGFPLPQMPQFETSNSVGTRAITQQIEMRTDRIEETPNYHADQTIRSALTGLEMPSSQFTHNNMVPFFRGTPKQNMSATANNGIMDSYSGTGGLQFNKKEQGPLFDTQREPTGNPQGFESTTDFMQDRIEAPKNRAGERPVEPIRVGPGLNEGFTSLPSGGFHQTDMLEYAKPRSTDDLRTANNPKLSYGGVTLPGKSLNVERGKVGEVRKYLPDRFFVNKNGERNFITGGDIKRERMRPMQVMKYVNRPETSTDYTGVAGSADFKATYNIPSHRAPMVAQHGEFGFRNADTTKAVQLNTKTDINDFGKKGIELLPNERSYTGERVMGLNLKPEGTGKVTVPLPDKMRQTRKEELVGSYGQGNMDAMAAGMPGRMTVYDPNDIARTTIRETTVDMDWYGAADGPKRLTVYDPDDIAKVTTRNTLAQQDTARNLKLTDAPYQPQMKVPDGVRSTQKHIISTRSAYTGAASSNDKKARVDQAERAMRHYPTRENVAKGRTPIAGNGNLPVFNGEDNMNIDIRKLDSDYINDRMPVQDKVYGKPSSTDVIGAMRPRAPLKLDVSGERANPSMLASLHNNPYNISLHQIARSDVDMDDF